MAFLELINLRKVRKALLYLLCIVAALWLQTMVFSRRGLLGVKPFFLPALIVAVGLFEGGVWGAMLGVAAGILCGWAMSGTSVLFLVLFAVCGFLSGLLAEFFINRTFFSCMLLSVLALAVTAVCQIVPLWIFRGTAPAALLPVAGLQVLWSLPFAALFFVVVKRIAGRERERQ